jgi:hypothetical protein
MTPSRGSEPMSERLLSGETPAWDDEQARRSRLLLRDDWSGL